MKAGTSPKTLRIPNDTIADIEKAANAKGTTFSDIAIGRLSHKGESHPPIPLILAKMQTILNLSLEGARTGSVEMIEQAQKEANKLWEEALM